MLKIAMTKGRIEKQVCELLEKAGYDVSAIKNKDRELVITTQDGLEFIFAKSNDVLTFLEHGIVDIGFVGKDTLDESDFDEYYDVLDLKVGKCYFAVASYKSYKDFNLPRRKRIASKYTRIAKEYFQSKNEDVDIIKLEGSVELAPIVGIADAIVDIVETGSTLKANGLEVIEKISEVSTRMICNKVSLIYKKEEVVNMIKKLKGEEIC